MGKKQGETRTWVHVGVDKNTKNIVNLPRSKWERYQECGTLEEKGVPICVKVGPKK